MLDMIPLPPGFSEMFEMMAYRNHPAVKFTGLVLDQQIWLMLNIWFLPYKMPGLFSETDQWIAQVSTNGARWANFCKPSIA